MANSENTASFGFGTDSNKLKQDNNQSPVKEETEEKVIGIRDEELNSPYTDKRSVTIALVRNYSLYRKVNDKVLPKKIDYIGSSYNSSMILSSSKEEVEAYFPSLLGIAANHDSFITRVKQYLNNIQVPVDELGKTFDTSFRYNQKRDYLKIAKAEEKIESDFNLVDRNNIKKLEEALKEKIRAINELEATKYKYGHPVNLPDYILYRHCLLYKDVAKDLAFINSDRSIRFYFKDDKKEADKAKKLRLEVTKAKSNYIACFNDDNLFDAVYIQYCVLNNKSVLSSLHTDRLDREIELDRFSNDEPIKFNKICANKDVILIGNIEKLIAYGELIRISNTQNITTADGAFIGSNIIEAISWFKNPENNSQVNAYMSKLNNM